MGIKLNNFIDSLIGELPDKTITTIYGAPGTGKTTLAFQYVVKVLQENKRVIYIDTENGFSPERLLQIDQKIKLENIIIFKPNNFEEQSKIIEKLKDEIEKIKDVGLIVIDSLVMLYRLKLGDSVMKLNIELGEQLRILMEISKSFAIPILVINQMYKDFETKQNRIVGGNTIEYWSKIIIEMDKDDYGRRFLKLIKHKYKKDTGKIYYKIDDEGLKPFKSFKFFK